MEETTNEATGLFNDLAGDFEMEAFSETLDPLMEAFYTPADISAVISEVSHNFLVIIAVILGVFPVLYMFRRFVRYAEKAFDTGAIREMESGGIFRRIPDGSLHTGLSKIAEIPAFKKVLRK